ncbi:MAG: hypothetical protein IJ410_01755 [Oscillospiraceae bacterium]|nr:hypothetical protein [Oscillospiraceae bacterium]
MAYTVKHINEKLIQIRDEFKDTIYIVKGKSRSILWDLGMDKEALKPLADSLCDTEYDVVCSHGHLDHVGRSGEFDHIYMSLEDMPVYNDNPPGLCYIDRDKIKDMPVQFDLGDRVVDIIPCAGHTPGSVLLLDKENRFVLTGDAIGSGCGCWMQVSYALNMTEYRHSLLECIEVLKSHGVNDEWNFYGGHADQEYMSRTGSYNRLDIHLMEDMARLCALLLEGKVPYEPSQAKEFPVGKPYFAMHKKAEMVFALENMK